MVRKSLIVPKNLRTWFIVHFVFDIIFGLPLLFFPRFTLGLFGFFVGEVLTARLVGAALIGIGTTSLIVRNEDKETFLALLKLKIIWSVAAIVGIIITLIEGAPLFTWLILIIFAVFSGTWMYYRWVIS